MTARPGFINHPPSKQPKERFYYPLAKDPDYGAPYAAFRLWRKTHPLPTAPKPDTPTTYDEIDEEDE